MWVGWPLEPPAIAVFISVCLAKANNQIICQVQDQMISLICGLNGEKGIVLKKQFISILQLAAGNNIMKNLAWHANKLLILFHTQR